jgi:hypothetical protein
LHGKYRRMKPAADSPLPAMKNWRRLAVLRCALVVFSHAPSLDRPNLPKLAGPEGLAPSRSDLEANPSARTSRTYWCPRPVARRLPSRDRGTMLPATPPGQTDGAGRHAPSPPSRACGTSAACYYWHYGPKKLDTTAGAAPANLGFAGWSLGCLGTSCSVIGKETAAQVTRRRKTSPTSVLNDRGLSLVEPVGVAPTPRGSKVRCADC